MIKVKNAIILAAGRGSRLKHLTEDMPKPLLAPKGIRFIDAIIKNLKEVGITEIIVVTGYLSKEFDYLLKEGIKLVHDPSWNKGNNPTSIAAAFEFLGDSLVINGDVVMEENVFKSEYPSSITYAEWNSPIPELYLVFDQESNVIDFKPGPKTPEGLYQREILFISKELAAEAIKLYPNFDINQYQDYMMVHAAHHAKIPFGVEKVPAGILYDIDNEKDFVSVAAGIIIDM